MLLQCAHCGAPLDVRENTAIVRCGYCGMRTERTRLIMIAHETPKEFQPPKQWRPPPHVPAPSDVELTYQRSKAPVVLGILAMLVVVGIGPAIALVAALHDKGTFAPKLAAFDKEIAGSPSALSQRFGGGRIADKNLYLKVDDPDIDQLYFLWKETDLTHPYYAGSIMKSGHGVPAEVCERMSQTLGTFRNNSWYLGDAYASCDPKSGVSVYISSPDENEHEPKGAWKPRVALLYRIEMDALLGREPSVTTKELRTTLGTGFSTADLAKIDLAAELDDAQAMLEKAMQGRVVTTDGTRFELVLGDGPLPHVAFSWNNAKGGKLSNVTFSTPGWQALEAKQQAKVAACLEKTLGKPIVEETDHVKKKVNYRFKQWAIYLYDTSLNVSQPSAENFLGVVKALDGCKV